MSLAGSRGGAPLWGLGQRPNCSAGDQYAKRAQQRRRQRSVPASNFAHPQMRPQAALFDLLHIVVRMSATELLVFSSSAAFFLMQQDSPAKGVVFFVAGESPLRRRGGGFAVAPSTPSQRTSMLLDFSRSRDFVSMLLDFFVAGASIAFGTPQSPCTPFLWEAHLSAPPRFWGVPFPHLPCKEVIA